MTFLTLLFMLLAVHAVADFPLQGDYMAREKANSNYILFMHALIHAAGVFLILSSLYFALAELILHALIDKAKTTGRINFMTDQALHILCKLIYVVLVTDIVVLT